MSPAGRVKILAWTLVAGVLADEVEARGGDTVTARSILATVAEFARGSEKGRSQRRRAVRESVKAHRREPPMYSAAWYVYVTAYDIGRMAAPHGNDNSEDILYRMTLVTFEKLGVAAPKATLDATLADARRAAEKEIA